MLRAVCLDIDDTLVDFTSAGRDALAELLGRGDMWPLWERITDAHVAMVVAGELDYSVMHQRRTACFLAELGVLAEHDDVAGFEARRGELCRALWRRYDDVLPCLDWLLAAGVSIAAVTNASGNHQRGKLAELGLAGHFDYVAVAGELGVAKPDPLMFETVCGELGSAPEETVHVGDKLGTDACGARDSGLTGVWLARAGAGEADTSGVHVIDSLDVLPELLVGEFVRIGAPRVRQVRTMV